MIVRLYDSILSSSTDPRPPDKRPRAPVRTCRWRVGRSCRRDVPPRRPAMFAERARGASWRFDGTNSCDRGGQVGHGPLPLASRPLHSTTLAETGSPHRPFITRPFRACCRRDAAAGHAPHGPINRPGPPDSRTGGGGSRVRRDGPCESALSQIHSFDSAVNQGRKAASRGTAVGCVYPSGFRRVAAAQGPSGRAHGQQTTGKPLSYSPAFLLLKALTAGRPRESFGRNSA
ncbi:Hypp7555 [Branchiostoma lanceolatum]|uniref:Hypp7555 protein n=1 Tax=Branchiostoma lanceolatum TaxID=7740 RepID=A0A8J9Z1D7_BRALA|nr:Hypp7555 [Branchiostoma lanceolatum]